VRRKEGKKEGEEGEGKCYCLQVFLEPLFSPFTGEKDLSKKKKGNLNLDYIICFV
jgi:hypothetical protein